MPHDCNTRHRLKRVSEINSASDYDPLVKLEEDIINSINNLKEETLEQKLNSFWQYGRRNNFVLSGIPENITDNQLENTVASILSDIRVNIQSEGIEA